MARRLLKIALGIVVVLVLVVGGTLAYIDVTGIPHYPPGKIDLKVDAIPERAARGRRTVQLLCASCHLDNDTGTLAGKPMSDVPKQFGAAHSANSTGDPWHPQGHERSAIREVETVGLGPMLGRDVMHLGTEHALRFAVEERIGIADCFGEAAVILGEDFDGTLVRDGWAPYRQFLQAEHQTCLAHLLRRCNELIEDHPHARLPHEVKRLLLAALELRARFLRKEVSRHGLDVARGRLIEEMVSVIESPGQLPAIKKFARHLTTEFTALFTFLFDPTLDATNWRAETGLRPAVITRKVCGGGNRTQRGARTQEVLASVLRTAAQRDTDASKLFVAMLRSTESIVPQALRSPVQ
jgi:hypothetical protein